MAAPRPEPSILTVAVLLLACSGRDASSGPPPAPDSLQARALGSRGAEVGWRDRSDGRSWFLVERRGPGQGGFSSVGLRPPGEGVWTDWGLAPGTEYSYRITALTDAGTSEPSASAAVRTLATAIPEPRVEVLDPMSVSPGVTLFNVEDPDDVYTVSVVMAVDEKGRILWHFEHEGPFVSETDLYPDGDVLAQVGSNISRMTRRGDLVEYLDEYWVHHDVDVLPWGNLLAITSVELMEKRDVGDTFSRDWIVEIDERTRLLTRIIHLEFFLPEYEFCTACIVNDVTGGKDWIHTNAVDYDLDDESLYLSVRNLNRIYKMTYPEAEIVWIMGDGGDFGQGLFDHQHNPVRIEDDRMLVFDNGLHGDPLSPDRSRVIEIQYDPQIRAARIVWEYSGPPAFYTEAQGDASRLENGNTLVVDSMNGRIVEVTRSGLPVWELRLPPPYYIYKAHRIENFP